MGTQADNQGNAPAIRLVVGDAGLTLPGIEAAIAADSRISLVASADSCSGVMELIDGERPDVALVSLTLWEGGKPSSIATPDLIMAATSGTTSVKMLMLAEDDERARAAQAIVAGTHGYVDKRRMDGSALCDAIAAAARGMIVIPALARALIRPDVEPWVGVLSPRERQVLGQLARGLTNAEMAGELGIREAHLRSLFKRLEVRNRTAAVSAGIERGLLVRD